MKKLYFISLLIFVCIIGEGQNSISSTIKSIIKKNKQGYTSYNLDKVIYSDSLNYSNTLWLLQDYLIDDNYLVRNKSYQLLANIGLRSNQSDIKEKVINYLIKGLEDKKAGIVGLNIKYLFGFKPRHFNKLAKSLLTTLARTRTSHYAELIKLTGYVGIQALIPYYKERISTFTQKDKSSIWVMHLALARMGDEWEVDYCLSRVKGLVLSQNVVTHLFPDLVFIDSKTTYDYLLNVILSDSKNCNSPQPDIQAKVICAFKVIELVAVHIENFPVTLNAFNEIETDDYDQLLREVRDWIQSEWNK